MSLCGPKFYLGRPPRLSLRLLPLTDPLRICFLLYTFRQGADDSPIRTDEICPNHSYCVACHWSTTGDVALGAFNSKFFFGAGTQISSLCGPKFHLGLPPRLSLRLLPLTGTLRRCFVFYTFSKGADNLPIRTDKMCPNHSHCAACHCSTTRDVAVDAFNSKRFFLWAPIFRVCVTQNCILGGLSGYLVALCCC